MRNKFYEKMKWKHIFLLLFVFLSMMSFMRYTAQQVQMLSGGTGILDLNPPGSPQQIHQTIITLGNAARTYYLKTFLAVDNIYAITYATFYFLTILFLLHKNKIRKKGIYIISTFPIAGMCFDWLENLTLIFLLSNWETESPALNILFKASNTAKFVFVYSSLLFVILSILHYFFPKVVLPKYK